MILCANCWHTLAFVFPQGENQVYFMLARLVPAQDEQKSPMPNLENEYEKEPIPQKISVYFILCDTAFYCSCSL